MRLTTPLLLGGFALAALAPARAQDAPEVQLSAGPVLTATGLGAGGTARVTPRFSASAEVGGLPFGIGLDLGDIEEVDYTVDLTVWSLTLMGHVHPLGGGFALGGGLFLGGYGLDGTGTPEGTVQIGDETYTAEEIGTAFAEFRIGGPAPVLEVGRRGRGVNVGVGVVLPVAVRVDVRFDGPLADDPAFQAALDAELQNIEDAIEESDLIFVDVLPFVRLGYQFGL